ncbi:MAG: hypothetical protein ACM3JD_00290, partial [Rudaea sp.]
DNRNKLGFQDTSAADSLLGRARNSAELLLQQFNPIGLLLALPGIAILYRRDRPLALVLLAFGGGIAAISVTLHAESTRFYFSGAYLMLALFFAATAAWLVGCLQRRPLPRAGLYGVLALLPLVNLGINFGSVDMSGYNQYDLYSRTVLNDDLAENAVVIAPWELATPLRYFQFVEGVRPDLLIVHESPVRPQYQKIMAAAHALHRPFYYVQFTPEDKNAPGARTVQAVGLPLLAPPSPQYPVDGALGDSIHVLGLDASPQPGPAGQFLRVAVYYQVVAAVGRQYKSDLEWNDIRGEPHGDWEHLPVTEYNRTDQWKAGDYYRDVWDVPLRADDPQGLYSPTLNWYTFDPETDVTNYDHPLSIELPPVRVGDFSAGSVPRSQQAEFSNGMTLLGFGINGGGAGEKAVALKPGQTLDLSLYWAAARPLDSAYTIFVHMQDEKGTVLAQSDHAPWQGMFPTDRWRPGETVRDTYRLELPADLPAGEYSLAVGVYRTADQPIPLTAGGSSVMLDTPLVADRK